MTRQRLVKMTYGDRNILVKALQSARGSIGLEVFEKLQALMNKTLAAPKRKLYLSETPILRLIEAAAALTVFS